MSERLEVYTAANKVEANAVLTVLLSHGMDAQIDCEMRQRSIDGRPGVWESISRIQTLPSDADAALKVIAHWKRKAQAQSESQPECGWTCPKCDTDIDAEFDVCWNCLYNPSAC